ncbi:MAG: DUF423 domain-containing protein [Pseudomonadota bacterium]
MILVAACVLGFVSVAFGAYAEHALREPVGEENFRFLMTAVRYNQVYAVVTLALGLAAHAGGPLSRIPAFNWSAGLFVLGTVLFSGSIYISVTFALEGLLILTPVGGVTLMVAWALLLVTAVLSVVSARQSGTPETEKDG